MAPGLSRSQFGSSATRSAASPPPAPRRLESSASMVSTRSTAATASSMATPFGRRGSVTKRSVFVSDQRLADLAADSDAAIQWADILSHAPNGSADIAQWKWLDDSGNFSLYSRQEPHKYAVLAVGVVPCSVPEVVRLLHSPDGDKYLHNMEGLYGDDFKDGAFVHRVNLRRLEHEGGGASSDDRPSRNPDMIDLTVKSATFNRSGLFHHHEKWSFLEATYRRDNGLCFEKLSTTLSPKDVTAVPPKNRLASSSHSFPSFSRRSESHHGDAGSGGHAKTFHDVTTAFSVQPDESQNDESATRKWQATRVFFYAEFAPPVRYGLSVPSLSRRPSTSSDKTIKQRLHAMARSCVRLTGLVRRRRLGVQVLADRKLVAFYSSPSKRCVCCNKSIVLLAIRQCRVCGQGVCTECSHKHERETKAVGSHRMLLEDIRVCDRCLDRVDRSDFSELNDKSLLGPIVHPNKPDEPVASKVLQDLLKDHLLNAETSARKASVMNVIKCVLDQDNSVPPSPASSVASRSSARRGGGAVLLASTKSVLHEADFVEALDHLTIKQVKHHEAELATNEGRSYVIDSSNPDQQMAFPMPANEQERLRAMADAKVSELINNSDELNIICELAAKEMDTFASMVTIVTPDEQQVVASNVGELQNATFPRAEAFCSHTIMDDRPILIPHPEADVRFHQCGPVQELGIRYYCGFPIKNQDDTVIGALCCINTSSLDMTETQFSAMTKLAQTASKVIQVQGKQPRPRTASSTSSKK